MEHLERRREIVVYLFHNSRKKCPLQLIDVEIEFQVKIMTLETGKLLEITPADISSQMIRDKIGDLTLMMLPVSIMITKETEEVI